MWKSKYLDRWGTSDNLVVATLICVLDNNMLHFHIQRFCAKSCTGESNRIRLKQTGRTLLILFSGIISSNIAGRAMFSNRGLCSPPLVLWRRHTTLERSDFNHFSCMETVAAFSGYLVTCLPLKCNSYVFPPTRCSSFRSLPCVVWRRAIRHWPS